MSWEVEFSQEASNYAIDSHPYNENVLLAIEELAFRPDGLPAQSTYQLLEDWCVWEVAAHLVIYQKNDVSFQLYIWLIKPNG